MTEQACRNAKAEAVKAIIAPVSAAVRQNFVDLLQCEIAEAHSEMENASDNITIWRAQGRAAGARQLLTSITRN